MKKHLPFFNWSLKKALDTQADNFIRARIKIIYALLLFALLKLLIVAYFSSVNRQWLQLERAGVTLIINITLIKLLLYMPSRLKLVAHIITIAATLIVWSNIFVYTYSINIATVQFVLMIMLTSFYTLNSGWGVAYSLSAALPVLIFYVFRHQVQDGAVPEELPSPGFETLVLLNFASMGVAHYLFYRAFHKNLEEKEQLNKELHLSIGKAEKLAASRANFLSTMSHELRTPLNSVIGITELLMKDASDEHQKENLNVLHQSSQDLLSLINNILDINKMDSDMLQLESVRFNLPVFINNMCSGLRIKAKEKQLDFIVDIDTALAGIHINSDPTRLAQVIYNLAGNAVKFTKKGSVTVTLKCMEKTEDTVDVLFSVTDTGVGIPPERHAPIFELFTQAEPGTSRKYGGTGLGLAIVKQVVALFNSTIQLESSEGKGSTFSFRLKFSLAPSVTALTDTSTGLVDISHLKILIAEDNEINKMVMKQQLSNLEIIPVMVDNGEEAYDAWLADDYDAVFIDLHMPVQDGYETSRQIRSVENPQRSKPYLVAFTASVTEQQHIVENGFDDFLYKPVSIAALRNTLEKVALRKNQL